MTEEQKREWDVHIQKSEYELIRIYCFRLVRNRALAEEFAQETFLRFLESIREREIPNRKAWLYRTSRNMIFDFFRRESKKLEIWEYLSFLLKKEDRNSMCEALIKTESETALLRNLDQLSLRHREAVRLKFQENLKYDEIAEIMQEPCSTVSRLVSEAIRQLRVMMKD